MSGGGSKTVDTGTKIPAYMEEGGQQTFDIGKQLVGQQYPTYPYARLAPLTPDQLAAFDITRANTGAWQPQMAQALEQTAAGATPVGAADISAYMNPYTSNVINSTVDFLNRQNERDINALHANMAGRGSYLNEDRRAVIDQLAKESNNRVVADIAGKLGLQGYQDALAQANTERARNLQAGGMYAAYAPQVSQMGASDAAALRDIGTEQQQQQQQNLSLAYDDFLRQFYYPQEQLSYLTSILGGTPYSTTQMTPVGTGNSFAQTLGGLGALAGGVGKLAAFSDERLKKNAKKVGETPAGHNVYEFEYKKKGPVSNVRGKHFGVFAQEVEKSQPSAVRKVGKYRVVDYAKVA